MAKPAVRALSDDTDAVTTIRGKSRPNPAVHDSPLRDPRASRSIDWSTTHATTPMRNRAAVV
jgi:hypothetical protein